MINNTYGEEEDGEGVIFYSLHGYGVTVWYLIANIITAGLAFWIVCLNCLVIDTMVKHRDSIQIADIFVASLAFADLLTGILLFYNTTYNVANYQNVHECRFRFGLLILVVMSSGGHLLFLAFDRYIKIIKPFHYTLIFSKSSVISICIALWIFAIIIGMLPSFGWKNRHEETNGDDILCSFFGTMTDGYLTLVVVLFWIPVILMIILYSHIFKVAHNHAKIIRAQETIANLGHTHHQTVDKQSWKFTKTISIIIGLYLIMWMPTGLLIIIYLRGALGHLDNSDKGVILLYVSTPAFLNSLLDPIIYAFKINVVKLRFKKIFGCCERKKKYPVRQRVTCLTPNSVPCLTVQTEHTDTIAMTAWS